MFTAQAGVDPTLKSYLGTRGVRLDDGTGQQPPLVTQAA
jgi:hypothetical protein